MAILWAAVRFYVAVVIVIAATAGAYLGALAALGIADGGQWQAWVLGLATLAALPVGWIMDWIARLISPEGGSLLEGLALPVVAWIAVLRPLEILAQTPGAVRDGSFAIFASQVGLVVVVLWLGRRVSGFGRMWRQQ